jgi:polyphosphate kinase
VANKAFCIGAWLEEEGAKGRGGLGVLTIPRSLPRVLALAERGPGHHYIFLRDVIKLFLADLFKGHVIAGSAGFRVTRNSNLYLVEDAGNLLESVEAVVQGRRKGNAVRLEIDADTPRRIRQALLDNFDLEPELVFETPGPVNLNRLMGLYQMAPLPDLKYAPHVPRRAFPSSGTQDVFSRIREGDILLHHPFDSFEPVVDFIRTAARDPEVVCIKQTLYRTSTESPIVYALLEAAGSGKEVTVVVELQARFDENSNIQWARQLQDKGGTVVYGLVGLKTHCKLALVLRREGDGIRPYAHVGTGNYHPETAKLYTDLGLLTADRALTDGVSDVFNYLTSHAREPRFDSLLVGPVNFLGETLRLIRNEARNAGRGRPSGITAKMNALVDAEVIDALYEASRAGVPVRLLVRGICALRPGVPGLSDNIEVRSVLGRFLEHSRIFRFENGGLPQLYIGSGDWMSRNLRERVEALVPIHAPELRRRLEDILSLYWADDAKSHVMGPGGGYLRRAAKEGAGFEAQRALMENPECRPSPGQDLFPLSATADAAGVPAGGSAAPAALLRESLSRAP